MEQSDQIEALAAALCEFQGSIAGAKKGGQNPHFRNNYTRLEDAWAAAREQLCAHGLSVTQWPESGDGGVTVTTRVMHKTGQWIQGTLAVPVSKHDAQGVGSAITYGCRYAFLAALGLPPTDDDGNAAAASPPPQGRQQAAPQPRVEPKANPDLVLTFGKHKGQALRDVPSGYVRWLADQAKDHEVRAACVALIESNGGDEAPPPPDDDDIPF
jgi:hypothetical protein